MRRIELPDGKYLTEREGEVLTTMMRGYTAVLTGDLLCCSPRTVNCHLRHVYEKLEVHGLLETRCRLEEWDLLERLVAGE